MREWAPLAVLLGSRSGRTEAGDRPVEDALPIALVGIAAVALLGTGTSHRFSATASSLGF
jgi:hypothetical protein